MGKKTQPVKEPELKEHVPLTSYTGSIWGLTYKPHNGFADYSVTEFVIQDNKVVGIIESDPYAGIEALLKLELQNARNLEKLRVKYPAGYRFV